MPTFLLRLSNEDELVFNFTFILRQTQIASVTNSTVNGVSTSLPEVADTVLTGLTFAHASNSKELDNLITREFHANPNLQNNSNVQLVGDFSTDGSPSIQFEWSWNWRPPKATEDKGGGWRNSCSFLDYDQRTNRLNTLAHFSFWVHSNIRFIPSPQLSTPNIDFLAPTRSRLPSSQSTISDLETNNQRVPSTPVETSDPLPAAAVPLPQGTTTTAATTPTAAQAPPVKVDLPHSRPGEDMSVVDDGPLFRATMKTLEQKTGSMRTKIKKVLKKADATRQAQAECNDAMEAFLGALKDGATSKANAMQPALDHYFERIARQILSYEQLNSLQLQKLVVEPLSKLYHNDIKQAESKKKEFDEESRDYYAYVGRYLGQRQDSLKEKKRAESDSKYQSKRRNFELKRFDYSSFMQDLNGGRKEQEVLSYLTKYADTQAKSFLAASRKVEEMVPQLEALIHEVNQADKEFQFQRTEREEKRRMLEKSSNVYIEPEAFSNTSSSIAMGASAVTGSGNFGSGVQEGADLGRADSTGSQLRRVVSNGSSTSSNATVLSPSTATVGSTGQGRFAGIRGLDELDARNSDRAAAEHKKEGLLWALSRPGSHIDPKGINKQAWHKCVSFLVLLVCLFTNPCGLGSGLCSTKENCPSTATGSRDSICIWTPLT